MKSSSHHQSNYLGRVSARIAQYFAISTDTERNLLAGIGSGAIFKATEYPLDTVKVLLQSNPTKYSNQLDCFKQTYNLHGVSGFYKGLSTPFFGAMITNSILFTIYGLIKKNLQVNNNPTLSNPNPMWKYCAGGAISGVFAAFILTPIELIKCNMQAQTNTRVKVLYKGPIDFIVKTANKDGVRGFWKGNVACLMREIPGSMVWFGTYELVRTRVIQPAFGYETLREIPLSLTMFAGGCAGVAYWAVPYPIDTVKSSVQIVEKYQGMTAPEVFRILYKEQGIKGFYRGCGLTCARGFFSNAILFYAYEVIYKFSGRIFREKVLG